MLWLWWIVMGESVSGKKKSRSEIKYYVDRTIPYKLDEDFTHTKVCAFSFQGVKYEVESWIDMTYKICCILYQKDKVLFEKIARGHKIKRGTSGRGQVLICFKDDQEGINIPEKLRRYISDDIILFNKTKTCDKTIPIQDLLSEYHMPKDSISIYLKWVKCNRRSEQGLKPIGTLLGTWE